LKTEVKQDTGYGLIPRQIMRDQELSIQSKAIYAYLASFAGNTGKAFPSVSLMLRELGVSKDTFYKYMGELERKGAIAITKEREQGRFSKNIYHLNSSTKSPCPKSSDTVLSDTVLSDTVNQDTNSNNLNSNNVNSNKENTASKKPKEKKELYLDFVRLTLSEYEKLAERLGEEKTKDYIESLNNYIGSKGRRYKSHYHTILAWSRKDETQLKEEPARKIRFMGVDDG